MVVMMSVWLEREGKEGFCVSTIGTVIVTITREESGKEKNWGDMYL